MRVLVCGDRHWGDLFFIKLTLISLKPSVVIEGEARGADTLGRLAAEQLGIQVEKFPAEWLRYGKSAGVIRNQRMIDEGKPDLVVGFHDRIEESKGTKDMLQRSEKRGIKTLLLSH